MCNKNSKQIIASLNRIAGQVRGVGQMVEDVALAAHGEKPVYVYAAGMRPPQENVILEMAENILAGKEKEAF